ncbi:hypothetical protein Syun_024503 [Stephania yunnanensis]|uniref:Uncharacterized protein n=1 Tax=Stephania yunnanensis TaxID=152371 RepID=A0AAP0I4G6_9MAGN
MDGEKGVPPPLLAMTHESWAKVKVRKPPNWQRNSVHNGAYTAQYSDLTAILNCCFFAASMLIRRK